MEQLMNTNFLALVGIALAGAVSHAVLKWANDELPCGLYDYFFTVGKKGTVGAVMTIVGGVAGAVLAGTLGDPQDSAHVLAAWGIGFAVDSRVNGPMTKKAAEAA